jgi:hypothetical protein
MQHQTPQKKANEYLAVRLEARRHGRRLGTPEGELETFLQDPGTAPVARMVRAERERARRSHDPYALSFEERASTVWTLRTRDLVLSALSRCRLSNRAVQVEVTDKPGVQGWLIRVHPSWIASVHARGVAVVNGLMTLTTRHYPHTPPDGAKVHYASWLQPRHGGFEVIEGALYRASRTADWEHVAVEHAALDRILENAPTFVMPRRKVRSLPPARFLVRAALTAAEHGLLEIAANTAGESVSAWVRRMLLRAVQVQMSRRTIGVLHLPAGRVVVAPESALDEGLALAAAEGAKSIGPARRLVGGVSFAVDEGFHAVLQTGDRVFIGRTRG